MLWGVLEPMSLHSTIQSSDMVETVFGGFLGAIITGATLVVSISQLVLSQEIGSLGSLRSRMDTTMDVRQSTDELLGTTTPSDPTAYLELLIEASERRTVALQETLAGGGHERLREQVDASVADLTANADHARERLRDSEFGTFEVISAALDYDYNRRIHDFRQLAREHEADLTDEERRAFGNCWSR